MTTSNNTVAKAGLVLPGLGHLLQGKLTPGIGMLSLLALLATSAVAGFTRIGSVMFSGQAGSLSIHAVVALVAWTGLALGLWYNAYRLLHPRVLTDEERNSNRQIFLRQLGKHRTGMIGLFGGRQAVARGSHQGCTKGRRAPWRPTTPAASASPRMGTRSSKRFNDGAWTARTYLHTRTTI